MTHVLVAPDKFRGSLTARQAADALARGLARARPDLPVRRLPVADGGEGTVAAALAAGFRPHRVRVRGPVGDPVSATIAVRGDLAVVETATACGLALLPAGRRAPLTASSFGAGQLLLAAVDAGCTRVLLGVGGSASTDGGAGLLAALGARPHDAAGDPVAPGGAALAGVAGLDLTGLDARVAGLDVVLACDVDNPLLGARGAAPVFAPQKGAGPAEVRLLADALRHWAAVVRAATGRADADRPGAGAAGGIGFAALAVLGARPVPGIEALLDLVGFADHLAGAGLVITGEGSLDEQSLHGKAPIGVVAAARRAGVPAVVVAGRCRLDAAQRAAAGIAAVYPLTDLEPDPRRCLADAAALVARTAERVAADWLPAHA